MFQFANSYTALFYLAFAKGMPPVDIARNCEVKLAMLSFVHSLADGLSISGLKIAVLAVGKTPILPQPISTQKRSWYSGSMLAFQAGDAGSIPAERNLFFALFV